jgi:hypothetical protein
MEIKHTYKRTELHLRVNLDVVVAQTDVSLRL